MKQSGVSRRRFGSIVGGATAATVAASLLPPATADAGTTERPFSADLKAAAGERPNLLVILADDLGWADLSCYGAPEIKTPHLDALATSGVRFTDGYAASSTCSPTRIGLYTGRYPGRLRGGLAEPMTVPRPDEGIPADHPTLASLLAASGYTTVMYGKWHCGSLPWYSPLRSGWQEFFGNFNGAMDYFSHINSAGLNDLYEGEVPTEEIGYYTELLGGRAADFVSRVHQQPWLMNLNFTSPHWPWEGPGDQVVSDELTSRTRHGELHALEHHDGGSLATYREMVESMDAAIGRVMQSLRESGQGGNTVVVFSSDNGGERYSYQWPLSGGKHNLYEGGIRVPTILSWPDRIRGSQQSAVPVTTLDWTATVLDLAEVEPDPDYPLDGSSLAGYLLRGEPAPDKDLFWRIRDYRALRRGQWKYLQTPGEEGEVPTDHLFELPADPREQADLAAKNPDLVASMRESWESTDSTLLRYPPEVSDVTGE